MKSNLKINFNLLYILFLLATSCNQASTTELTDKRVEKFDVAYTTPTNGNPQMTKLDIYYIPDGKPKNLMVFIHGGGWVGGDKSNLKMADAMIEWFLERDYVVAAPNYRLATRLGEPQEVTYSEQAIDIVHALAWLKENGVNYGVTEDNIILVGFSAGAHLVSLISSDHNYLQSVGLSPEHIAGTVSFDVHAYDVPFALRLMEGSVIEQNIPFIEFLFGSTEVEQLEGSPSFYVSNTGIPPSIIISAEPSETIGSHGYITSQASQQHVQLLLNSGHQAIWKHYNNETHSSLVLDFGTNGDEPTNAVADFLNSL